MVELSSRKRELLESHMKTCAVALGTVVLVAFVATGPQGVLGQQLLGGVPLAGSIRLDQGYNCGGATYSISLSEDHRYVVHVSVDGYHAGDQVFSGSSGFPIGAVPIDPESGSFSVYFPGREPGQEITVSGVLVLGEHVNQSFPLFSLGFSLSPHLCADFGIAAPEPGGLPYTGRADGTSSGEHRARSNPALLLSVGIAIVSFASYRLLRRTAR